MKTVGAFEAKTKLSQLLRSVEEHHEGIIIQKHNRNIARLIPFEEDDGEKLSKDAILGGLRKIRDKQTHLSVDEISAMIEEGRKR